MPFTPKGTPHSTTSFLTCARVSRPGLHIGHIPTRPSFPCSHPALSSCVTSSELSSCPVPNHARYPPSPAGPIASSLSEHGLISKSLITSPLWSSRPGTLDRRTCPRFALSHLAAPAARDQGTFEGRPVPLSSVSCTCSGMKGQ